MNLCLVGAGYVGLMTGAVLAHLENHVTSVDKNAEKVAGLGQGRLPIYEPGLEEIVRRHRRSVLRDDARPVSIV